MRKGLWVLIAMSFMMVGCGTGQKDETPLDTLPEAEQVPSSVVVEEISDEVTLNILVPHGSTAMAVAHMNFEHPELLPYVTYEFEPYPQGPDALIAAFTSESSNVIVAGTNVGASLYQKGVPYQLAATIGWGNLFLISDESLTIEELSGKTITAFGQGSTPEIVINAMLDYYGLTDSVQIEYVNSVADVQALFAAGEAPIALIAEPSLTVLKSKVESINLVADCQAVWGEIFGGTSYPQASLFVHNNLVDNHPEVVEALLKEVETSIIFANESPEEMAKQAIETGLEMPEPVIAASSKFSNIMYKSAKDAKTELQTYLEQLYNFDPKTVGGQLPDDQFYYVGN